MFVIGITGGIGCGKSTVAGICDKAGLPVIDADTLSREVTAAGGKAIPEIREAFGNGVIAADGSLDRKAMAKIVFREHCRLDELSRIVHRQVIERMRAGVKEHAKKKTKALVLDVPIPVKEGFIDLCDQIWVVWTSDENRLERLQARGMDEEEARRRMDMQMTQEEYLKLADRVLENDGSLNDLLEKVLALMEKELSPRGIRYSRDALAAQDQES